MYDPATTDRALDLASARQGWPLVRHTLAQVDHAIGHFQDLFDPERGGLKRALTPEEARFIQNERRVCALDFRYWATRYSWVVDWRKQAVRFVPNIAQAIILDLWADRERQGLAIWLQHLKARRLGVSTITELAVNHRFQFHPHSNGVVASADPTKTLEMAGMIKFNLDQQPWWLLPQGAPKIKAGIPVEFPDIRTSLTFQAGNQFTGVARGSTPNVIHLSELMEWQDAEDLVDGALMRAVIDAPNVFGVLESTGGGVGGWWHKTWEQNKRDFARGRARVIPAFLPWYVGTDLYPSAADLLARPVPPDWIPSDRTVAHAERARQYVLANPLLFQYLAKGDRRWRMPREQMWWREIEYDTYREKKQLHIFHMELAGDDFEAFQSSAVPVIDPEVLIGYQERTRAPLGVYTIIGPDIPPPLVAPRRYWSAAQPPVVVKTREILPRLDATYQLVPLTFEGYPTFDEQLRLLVWEWPSDEYTYGIGVDCAEGVGQDNAVISVLREATPSRAPGQVAEWAGNTVTAFQLWPLVLALAALYSTYSPLTGGRRQCRLAIEAFTNGAATQNELQKRGWVNFHPWKYNDTRRPKPDATTHRIGVYTNQWFRAAMLDMLLTCLSEEAIDLPSPYLVQELTTLERPPGGGKVEASAGAHDDRVMALGFPLFSLHMNKPPAKQFARRRVEYAPGMPVETVAHPTWTPPAMAIARPGPLPSQPILARRAGGLRAGYGLGRYVNRSMPRGFQ
jgi:hypothetical protein